MPEPPIIRVSQTSEIEMRGFGDGQYYAIVDNFLDKPHELISNVAAYAGNFVSEPLGHPSKGRDLTERELREIQRFLRYRESRKFPSFRSDMFLRSFLSNVSLKPEELSAFHRMCHIDPRIRPDRPTYAGVVYLFTNPELGGTAFYRWKNKEIPIRAYALASRDQGAALTYLKQRTEIFRKPPKYMTTSNEIAELLTVVPAKFNRLVFYNGDIPHSAQITQPDLLSSDPAVGRLTLNLFVSVRPNKFAAM